jgi:hypothetical protein
MDDATSRTRSTSRHMATAKPAATTRRSSSGRSSKKSTEPVVSPARWAGVALVIAAIVGAIVLAMISPSDPNDVVEQQPGGVVAAPSPTPSPTVADTRVPTVQPRITIPLPSVISEVDIPVTVDLPEEDLPKRLVTLYIKRGEEIIGKQDTIKTGTSVTVQGVRLAPGENLISAVLGTPAGLGPASEPVKVTVDRNAPSLKITAPKNKSETYEDTVLVEGTSEVGANVHVKNTTNDDDKTVVVGPSGEFSVTVRLKRQLNKIEATSVDNAGVPRTEKVRVTRLDGRPTIKITAPDEIKRSSLPKTVRIVIDVSDAAGNKMEGAQVAYTLGAPDRTSLTEPDETNANGRSVWQPEIEPASATVDRLELGVVVTSPTGHPRTREHKIELK